MNSAENLEQLANKLSSAVEKLRFKAPVSHVYNPLHYAGRPHREYLKRYGKAPKRVVFVGMNPGPWGMAQTGIPFGEINAVLNWLSISKTPIDQAPNPHPKRPILGWSCERSEVSGRRLWGLFKERFDHPENFFKEHFVLNYCPLLFLKADANTCANLTPDKLCKADQEKLFAICDAHLRAALKICKPQYAVGIGQFAKQRIQVAIKNIDVPPKISSILHPSPASPRANRNWSQQAQDELQNDGIWPVKP